MHAAAALDSRLPSHQGAMPGCSGGDLSEFDPFEHSSVEVSLLFSREVVKQGGHLTWGQVGLWE